MVLSWLESLLGENIGTIGIEAFSPTSFVLLLIPLFFLRRRGKSIGYLLCFYLFSLYAWAALAHTILEFPVHSSEARMIHMRTWSKEINLVPSLLSGKFNPSSEQVYGNFLLGVPYGFGLPFVVARSTHKRMVLLGLGFAAGIELAQLLLGLLLYQAPYRVIDIDDVWLVFTGTLAGYGTLWVAACLYRRIGWGRGAHFPIWNHFHEVLLCVTSGHTTPLQRPASSAPAAFS